MGKYIAVGAGCLVVGVAGGMLITAFTLWPRVGKLGTPAKQ